MDTSFPAFSYCYKTQMLQLTLLPKTPQMTGSNSLSTHHTITQEYEDRRQEGSSASYCRFRLRMSANGYLQEFRHTTQCFQQTHINRGQLIPHLPISLSSNLPPKDALWRTVWAAHKILKQTSKNKQNTDNNARYNTVKYRVARE
jgi:hypothetical protein